MHFTAVSLCLPVFPAEPIDEPQSVANFLCPRLDDDRCHVVWVIRYVGMPRRRMACVLSALRSQANKKASNSKSQLQRGATKHQLVRAPMSACSLRRRRAWRGGGGAEMTLNTLEAGGLDCWPPGRNSGRRRNRRSRPVAPLRPTLAVAAKKVKNQPRQQLAIIIASLSIY